MADDGYLKFTGDYASLKTLGYKFQKLFAGNYMSWSKEGVFIFKKGADVSHGNINLFKLVEFLKTDPAVRISPRGIAFYKFYSDPDTNQYDYYPLTEENRTKYRANMDEWGTWDKDGNEPAPEYMSMEHVSNKILDLIKELNDRGWIETAHWEDK
jgi:hypothetical protein